MIRAMRRHSFNCFDRRRTRLNSRVDYYVSISHTIKFPHCQQFQHRQGEHRENRRFKGDHDHGLNLTSRQSRRTLGSSAKFLLDFKLF